MTARQNRRGLVMTKGLAGYYTESLHLLRTSVQYDIVRAATSLVRNTLAGSVLLPRVARMLLYRLSGLDIRTPSIMEGQTMDNPNLRIGPRTFVNRGCYFEGH